PNTQQATSTSSHVASRSLAGVERTFLCAERRRLQIELEQLHRKPIAGSASNGEPFDQVFPVYDDVHDRFRQRKAFWRKSHAPGVLRRLEVDVEVAVDRLGVRTKYSDEHLGNAYDDRLLVG